MAAMIKQLTIALALGLSTPAVAAPVAANPAARGKALILKPLTLTKLSDLHFGTIIPSNLSGVVIVPADGSPATAVGGVTLLASDPATRASFAGAGTAGQLVVVNATNPVLLGNGAGDSVTLLALTLDGPSTRMIDPTRAFSFNVGGILMIAANQPEGFYQADFDVTADYF